MGEIFLHRWSTRVSRSRFGLDELGETEVQKLHAHLREHDVGWLQIPMDDAGAMGLGERVCDLDRVLERLVTRERSPRQSVRKRLAFDELHDQEISPVLTSDVIQRTDVGMVQLRDRPGFPLEPLLPFWTVSEVRREHFDGDGSIEARVDGFVDLTHPARTDGLGDLVVAEASSGREAHEQSPSILAAGVRSYKQPHHNTPDAVTTLEPYLGRDTRTRRARVLLQRLMPRQTKY